MLLRLGHDVQDTTGILIHANAEVFCLESGLSGELFDTPLLFQDLVNDS